MKEKSSNVTTQTLETKEHRGNISYNFSPKSLSLQPFKNVSFFDSKILKLIKDINFNPLPSNINVRGDLNRSFNKTQYRNSDLTIEGVDPYF